MHQESCRIPAQQVALGSLLLGMNTSRSSDSAVLGQSIWRLTSSVVCRSPCEEGSGRNLPFSVEKQWRLPVMMTLHLGSAFAAPFFLVPHHLLKKEGSGFPFDPHFELALPGYAM
ncbi:cytochrome c oxidase subunit 7C, mitochondrial-like [Oryctolagus cuniculus]|uniref:cytochrome c oxidase subunit 7C, mitochondrial-like n=1 Tax=Oryctolagus cuniculus TaxID=9986 RepID=UPI003879CF32